MVRDAAPRLLTMRVRDAAARLLMVRDGRRGGLLTMR
jgi:hypothetical protein